jgi:hypothetical protein
MDLSLDEQQEKTQRLEAHNNQIVQRLFIIFDQYPEAFGKYKQELAQNEQRIKNKIAEINTLYDTLERIALERVKSANINEFIDEQKAFLSDLKTLILTKKGSLEKELSPEQKVVFDQFISQLDTHLMTIESADIPETLQALFGECAMHLNDFITAVEPIKGMHTSLTALRETSTAFTAFSQLKPPAVSTPPILLSVTTPKVTLETPSEAPPDTLKEQTHQMKAALQAHKAAHEEQTQKTDLYVISGDEDEDIEELIDNIEEAFAELKDSGFALPESKQSLFESLEKSISHLRATLDEEQAVSPSDIEGLKKQVRPHPRSGWLDGC